METNYIINQDGLKTIRNWVNQKIEDNNVSILSEKNIRIWNLNEGIYKLIYAGDKHIYYNGASGTNYQTIYNAAGKCILTVTSYGDTYKGFFIIYNSYGESYVDFGTCTETSGKYVSRDLSYIPTISEITANKLKPSAKITASGWYKPPENKYILLIYPDNTSPLLSVTLAMRRSNEISTLASPQLSFGNPLVIYRDNEGYIYYVNQGGSTPTALSTSAPFNSDNGQFEISPNYECAVYYLSID